MTTALAGNQALAKTNAHNENHVEGEFRSQPCDLILSCPKINEIIWMEVKPQAPLHTGVDPSKARETKTLDMEGRGVIQAAAPFPFFL